MGGKTRIAVLGDRIRGYEPHAATDAALRHAAGELRIPVDWEWIATPDVPSRIGFDLDDFHAFLITPGSPYRDLDGMLEGIRFARQSGKPVIGTCAGFQHVVLEFARNVVGVIDARSEEYDEASASSEAPGSSEAPRSPAPSASPEALPFRVASGSPDVLPSRVASGSPVIIPLSCSVAGQVLPIELDEGSLARRLYGVARVEERYYCQYGLAPDYDEAVHGAGLRIVGRDDDDQPRVVELDGRDFYLATLYVPQSRSRPDAPHPLMRGFVKAAIGVAQVEAPRPA